jgi:hypothetical protein
MPIRIGPNNSYNGKQSYLLSGCLDDRFHAKAAAAGSTISLEADFTKRTSDAEAR